MRFTEAATDDREILAVDVNDPAFDRPVARHDTVAQVFRRAHPEVLAAVFHELVDLHETPRVQQEVDPLAGRQLALLVLFRYRLLAAALLRFLAAFQKVLAVLRHALIRHFTIPPALSLVVRTLADLEQDSPGRRRVDERDPRSARAVAGSLVDQADTPRFQ